jgi:hypothetical protein
MAALKSYYVLRRICRFWHSPHRDDVNFRVTTLVVSIRTRSPAGKEWL